MSSSANAAGVAFVGPNLTLLMLRAQSGGAAGISAVCAGRDGGSRSVEGGPQILDSNWRMLHIVVKYLTTTLWT